MSWYSYRPRIEISLTDLHMIFVPEQPSVQQCILDTYRAAKEYASECIDKFEDLEYYLLYEYGVFHVVPYNTKSFTSISDVKSKLNMLWGENSMLEELL